MCIKIYKTIIWHKKYQSTVQNWLEGYCLLTYLSLRVWTPISKWARHRHKPIHQVSYTISLHVCTRSIQLTELSFLTGGVAGRPVRAARSPLPASRRPAVLLPSGYQEKSHPSAPKTTANHAGRITAKSERWDLSSEQQKKPHGSRSLLYSQQSTLKSCLQCVRKHPKIQKVVVSATHRSCQQHDSNCSTVGWTKERNLLSYFKIRLKGLRDTYTHTPWPDWA